MIDVRHINPDSTYNSLNTRGYTQVVAIEGAAKLVFISGQLPLDTNGAVVGAGDIEAQARAVFENIERSLHSAGADLCHIVKLTTYVTDILEHPPLVRKVRTALFGSKTPPASTMVEVPRFAKPEILIEIDAVAVC
jgi:2-iminobutanoate/2-iminopropanoate deaminase